MSPTLKSTGVGSLWAKISHWSRPLMFGSAESEHLRLTNGEIMSEEFQPMWSQSTNVTDRQTEGQTTCDHKTALCTKVVKNVHIHSMTRVKIIWQRRDRSAHNVVCKRSLVDIFYHISQVAAHVTKLVLGVHFGPHFGERGCRRGQWWYHSKEW